MNLRRLDRMLGCDSIEIVVELLMGRADIPNTAIFHTWTASSAEDLQYIEDRKVDKCTFPRIVDLGAFDDN